MDVGRQLVAKIKIISLQKKRIGEPAETKKV
jgi:hypothetical protein